MHALKMSGITKFDNVPGFFLRTALLLRCLFAVVPIFCRVVFRTAIIFESARAK